MSRNIFPENVFIDPKSKIVREKVQDFYDDVMAQNSRMQAEAHTDALIEAGDQNALNSLGFNRTLSYMDMYTTNKVRRMISMISGIQRRARKSSKCVPVEKKDQNAADQFTKIIYNINNNNHVLETISDSFQAATVTGLNLLQLWVDYRDDPISGDIKVSLCPYNSYIIDSNFKNPDLSDCRAIWKRSYLTPQEVRSLLPENKSEIDDLAKSGSVVDGIFPYLHSSTWKESSYMSYDEFYYRDYRKQKKLIDVSTGETTEFTGDDEILSIFLQQNPDIILREVEIPTVRLAICVNGQVFYDGSNPIGIDQYPFAAMFGYVANNLEDMYLRFQSLVRGMRDSQFLYNLMTSLEVEYIQSRVNPGIVYKPTSMIDPKKIEQKDLSGNFALKKNASLDDIRFITPNDFPQSLPVIRDQAGKEIVENDGANEEVMGTSNDQTLAAALSKMRQEAGKVGLEGLFDSLDRTQAILGKLQIYAIQSNYTPGKIQRIIEAQPDQQFYSKTFAKFDVVVEDGVYTSTQRQQQFTELLALKNVINIPDAMLIQASTIQNKQEIIDYMDNIAQQEAQAQQQEIQVNQQLQQAESDLATSQAEYNQARAVETISKVQDNKTQSLTNLSRAHREDEQATLNKAKAIKELEQMDFAQLRNMIDLVNVIKSSENKEQSIDNQRNINEGMI